MLHIGQDKWHVEHKRCYGICCTVTYTERTLVISGEMPILANTGTKMKDIKAHLAVADTIKRLTSAVKRMKRINIHKLLKEAEDSRLAPKMATHLSKWEYSKQANNL